MNKSYLKEIPLAVFGVFWILFLFFDYINKHPIYELSLTHFKFPKLAIFLLMLSAIIGFLLHSKKKLFSGFLSSGLSILVFSFFLAVVIAGAYLPFAEFKTMSADMGDTMKYAFKALLCFFPLLLILVSSYAFGNIFINRFKLALPESSLPIVSTALGIMLHCFLLFVLGIFGLLKNFTVIPMLILPLILNYKKVLPFLKSMFLKPLITEKTESTFLLGIIWTLLIAYLVLNYLGAISPFPAGFDSRNFYVNISKLLADYEALVHGFQPYTWSLFMAIGLIAFNSIEITLLISYGAIILTLWAGYELCRSYLKLSPTHTMIALFFLAIIPSIFNQMTIELKIDFGLLFIQFCSIFILVELVKRIKLSEGKLDSPIWLLVILLSVFTGYGIGVKLTHVYLVFAFMMMLWALYCGYTGFLGMFFITFFIILVGKLDDVSGMRAYHLGISYLQWVSLGAGLLLLGYSFVKNKSKFINILKMSIVIGGLSVFVFSPWMVKNFIESDKPSINSLLLGGRPGPDIDARKIINNYRKG